jgi:hypothetical protein
MGPTCQNNKKIKNKRRSSSSSSHSGQPTTAVGAAPLPTTAVGAAPLVAGAAPRPAPLEHPPPPPAQQRIGASFPRHLAVFPDLGQLAWVALRAGERRERYQASSRGAGRSKRRWRRNSGEQLLPW